MVITMVVTMVATMVITMVLIMVITMVITMRTKDLALDASHGVLRCAPPDTRSSMCLRY